MKDTRYLQALDDEIGKDVYFYHNQINDKLDIFTVGCEISQWDGEKIAALLNIDNIQEESIIFNTCAVTNAAQLACERIAERLSRVYPYKKFYFVGCGVNYNPDFYSQYGTIVKNENKFNVKSYGFKEKNSISQFKSNRHRKAGFVKIEDGCYNNCAYCVIHKIRPHYVVPYEKIKKQIRELLNQGKTDIQLIGTEITCYNDNGLKLTGLCKKILEDFPEIECLIIGALDPASKELDSLIELIKKDKRVFNSLYLCTQSCSDSILKSMNRRHDIARLEELKRLSENKIDFVYQLIIGFPGETDKLFKETVDNLTALKPIDIDTIPFSPRIGTPAYDMNGRVSKEEIIKRENILYNAVRKYSSFEDGNTLRGILPLMRRDVLKFMDFRPKLDKNEIVLYIDDLYGEQNFIKVFNRLKEIDQNKQIVICTYLHDDKDIYDFDVNTKLLIALFGIKIIARIKIDDNSLKKFLGGYYSAENFAYRFCLYLNFSFDKLETTSKEDLLEFFKNTWIYNLDDINSMLLKLIKSRNKEHADYIVKELDIAL